MAVFGSSNSIGKWSSSSFGGTGSSFGGSVFGNTTASAFASSSISGRNILPSEFLLQFFSEMSKFSSR